MLQIITTEKWTEGAVYLPAARINKPIGDFSAQFNTAVAPLKSGTPGIRFLSGGHQFILREVKEENVTELLVPMIDATNTARSVDKVEYSLANAMKDLSLKLANVTSLHKDLNRDRLEWVMGFGLGPVQKIDSKRIPVFDLNPIEPPKP